MKNEYNLLTKRLLAEGYTAENHPDYVYVGRTCQEKENPLDNLDGGFEYYGWYSYSRTYRTPCGLQCIGRSCMTGLGISKFDFTFENDMATIACPYNKTNCEKKHELLRGAGAVRNRCNVHMVDEEYQYEGSVEGLLKQEDERIQREKISFSLERHGRTCEMHMHYDRDKDEWRMWYDPCECARMRCTGNFGKKTDGERLVCPILGKPLDSKKGNVFYDIKTAYRRYDLDGTLFEGQIDTHIEKGVRFMEHPVSMDICRNIVKLCKDEIKRRVILNRYHDKLFFAEYYGRYFTVEILNIRAEQRESRDLMQDLQDIKDGITISHASDSIKREKEEKKRRRQQGQEKRINRLEKKLLETGYYNLEEHSLDRVRADRLLGEERIAELEEMRRQKIEEEQSRPEQMSLFDFPEVMQ